MTTARRFSDGGSIPPASTNFLAGLWAPSGPAGGDPLDQSLVEPDCSGRAFLRDSYGGAFTTLQRATVLCGTYLSRACPDGAGNAAKCAGSWAFLLATAHGKSRISHHAETQPIMRGEAWTGAKIRRNGGFKRSAAGRGEYVSCATAGTVQGVGLAFDPFDPRRQRIFFSHPPW